MQFQTIICDPPWGAKDLLRMSSVKRGAAANYDTLTTEQLCALPIKDISDPNGCVLALWVLGSMLQDGLDVMNAWGFQQKQVYVWNKTKQQSSINKLAFKDIITSVKKVKDDPKALIRELSKSSLKMGDWLLGFGMGRLFRSTHEICLIGINNTKIYRQLENKSQRSVCFDINKGHSIKPEALQDSLELMFPHNKKCELFARRQRNGWVCLGNEVCDGEDITVSLNRVKNE